MHQSELEQLTECIACGAAVNSQDRLCPCGDDQVLCFACATARNGVYEEGHDRWAVAPYVADLLKPTASGRGCSGFRN